MSQLNDTQQIGINDFLQQLPESLVIDLARLTSKNLLSTETRPDAINVILLHSSSVESILNRKCITKDLIFQYLHSKRIATTSDFTKQSLIEKTTKYWTETYKTASSSSNEQHEAQVSDQQQSNSDEFPINQMAKVFVKWFFQVYNNDELKKGDFWPDAKASLQIVEGVNDNETSTTDVESTESILELLQTLRMQYQFFFNPNDTKNGVQGRLDVHGLAYVLNCGTLHAVDRFVGVYECAFGLLRDPFCDNNWKIKHLKLRVRSTMDPTKQAPCLQDCDSLREMLAILPANSSS